jgi:hypothetical protein
MISAESLLSNLRRALWRKHGKTKPMKNRIVLKSFSVLSFDAIKVTAFPVPAIWPMRKKVLMALPSQ